MGKHQTCDKCRNFLDFDHSGLGRCAKQYCGAGAHSAIVNRPVYGWDYACYIFEPKEQQTNNNT